MCLGKCLSCVGINKTFLARQAAGIEPDNVAPPVIQDAVTLAPAWQQMQAGMNTVIGCVALPTCLDHVDVKEMSAVERAVQGGRVLPGAVDVKLQ